MTQPVKPQPKSFNPLRDFLQMEAAGGIILVICAVLAMIIANIQPWGHMYEDILHHTRAAVSIGDWSINKDIIHWINDGLMAIFFFLVGLEIKREVLEGKLKGRSRYMLPVIAAVGGMTAPALIYTLINMGNDQAMVGWAIPAATDIAFAVGVIILLGKRVPVALKVFLLAVAIIDDLGAIIIIALFYTSHMKVEMLMWALPFLFGLFMLNRLNVNRSSLYVFLGICLWVCVLKSGIHATLAGVVAAFAVPLYVPQEKRSLLKQLEHGLHPFVAFIVLPVFAFANAGVALHGASMDVLFESVTLGVILGLVVGKPVGILAFTWLSEKSGLAKLPDGVNYKHVIGVGCLAGIGFTMSLFIGTLGFVGNEHYLMDAKLGIMTGSVISAVLGAILLMMACPAAVDQDYSEPGYGKEPKPAKAPTVKAASKPVAKKTVAKKVASKKAPAKKPAAKKAAAKPAAKKAPAKKSVAKKAPAKKTTKK